MADGSIICWNCNEVASSDQDECLRCKAGLRPYGDGGNNEQFLAEQVALRRKLGLEAIDLAPDALMSRWKRDWPTQPPNAVVVQARHASGLGLAAKSNVSLWFTNDQVYFAVNDSGPTPARYRTWDASDVGYISVESAGTKSNVGAIVLFGVFGLGARRDWSVVSIDLAGSEAVVLVREPVYAMRETMRLASQRCPSLEGKIVEGPPPVAHAPKTRTETVNTGTGVVAEMERLATLYEKGLINDEEFAALKAALISGG